MSDKVRRYLCVVLVGLTLFLSQVACDEGEYDSQRRTVGTVGCKNPTCRDACGGDTHCRIECCN